ncbi:DUF362 domain-containing protein [Candidatus Poribacteria bacterium]|nr:DUF362 domain-containing protein [Candidatus Poribacteria bacterium]
MSSKVALIKGDNRRENILKALHLIHSQIEPKISGKDVIVKPNCLQAGVPLSCTHVDALRGVMEYISDIPHESVVLAECCKDSEQFESYKKLAYDSLVNEYKIFLTELQSDDYWAEMKLLSKYGPEVNVRVSRMMVNSECRISVAVAKTHDTVIMTGSWKNMMGSLALEDKVKMHGCNSHSERVLTSEIAILPQNLVRLAKIVPPHIAVIDGYIGMEGNGPVSGNEKSLGIAIASIDFVAADAVCAKAMGFEPMDISYLNYGHQVDLGIADLRDIEILGDSLDDVIKDFTPHKSYSTLKEWRKLAPAIPG